MSPHPGYAVIDLETTGFGGSDRIIEVGVVLLDAQLNQQSTWETLVQPHHDVSNSHVHKLTATHLKNAPHWEEVAPQLARVLAGRIGVAHNASFEKRFLSKEFRRVAIPTNVGEAHWVDTKDLAVAHLGCASLKDALAAAGITNTLPHAALPDAEATAELLRSFRVQPVGEPLLFDAPTPSPFTPLTRNDVAESDSVADEGWLARLAQSLPAGAGRGTDSYREQLRAALADRRLTAEEIDSLATTAQESGLTGEDIVEIHEDFIRQIAVEAWLDGVVTDREEAELSTLAGQLDVDPMLVHDLLAAPQAGAAETWIALRPRDRVTFTGAMDLPRETWEARALTHGLEVGGVSKKTVVVVAANPDSMSGKARKARDMGIPIVSEKHFAALLATMEVHPSPAPPAEPVPPAAAHFTWVSTVMPGANESDLAHNEIAALWISNFPAERLLGMSEALAEDTAIDLAGSSAARAGTDWAQRYSPMLYATVEDLRDIPGVGAKRLERMVEAVVLAAIDAEPEPEAAPDQKLFSDTDLAEDIYADDPLAFADPYSGETSETEQELDILAGWLALTDVTLPHGVRGLAPGVEKRMAGDVLEGLFARCVDELMAACADDTRKMTIVSRRYMGDATLEDLGTLFDVSRERIRQLESQIKRDFDAPSTLSTDVAEALAEKFLPLSKFAEVNAEIPALTRIAEPFAGTYKHYFRMWGLWETDETWIAAPGFAESVDAALATHADSHNVARIADVAADLGADPRLLAEWMAGRSGLLLLPDATHVVLATSHADRAAGVLSLSGEPMTAADIVTATGLDINERSLSNALAADDRIVRVAPTLFALQDWGMEEYSSITDWIAARVAASPTGSVPLTDLLAEAPSIGVSENSVRAYASGAAFLLEDGQVSLPTEQGELIDADPQDYRDLYWHDDAWHMLLTVTHDHLRGSGFAVPRGVAGIYRVPVGGEVAVPSRLGDQFVRVNDLKHSSTSTIRRFLMEAEASEGDRVWLRFAPDGFNLTPAPARRFPVADGADGAAGTAAAPDLPRLLDQMALDPDLASDPKAALTSINEALGLDASAPRRRTVSVFRHRGQDEEADLIRGL